MPSKKAYYNPDEDKGVIARSWWSYEVGGHIRILRVIKMQKED
jgi:hypothetical protein